MITLIKEEGDGIIGINEKKNINTGRSGSTSTYL